MSEKFMTCLEFKHVSFCGPARMKAHKVRNKRLKKKVLNKYGHYEKLTW